MSLNVGDFVIQDNAIAKVEKLATNRYGSHSGIAAYTVIYEGWYISEDAPLLTFKDIIKRSRNITHETKPLIKEALYWCLAREGFDLSSLK